MLISNKTTQSLTVRVIILPGEGNERHRSVFQCVKGDKTVTMSMTVSNAELYEENKNHSQKADYTEFQDRSICRRPGRRVRRSYEVINW